MTVNIDNVSFLYQAQLFLIGSYQADSNNYMKIQWSKNKQILLWGANLLKDEPLSKFGHMKKKRPNQW